MTKGQDRTGQDRTGQEKQMYVRQTCTTLAAAVALACGDAHAQAGAGAEIESANPAIERVLEQREEVAEHERNADRDSRADPNLARAEAQLTQTQEILERRDELTQMADTTIEQLREDEVASAGLLEAAHGYAVFDTTKGGLIVTGAGGTGVAREKSTGENVFMHLGAAGVGVGGGLENYRMVLLFEDEETYDAFVEGQWDGSISAQAAAGAQGAAAEEQFVDGVRIFRLTDSGLIAQVDVSGLRFWRSERLNDV
jgi:lipid-binding SYLF domain-containing protein